MFADRSVATTALAETKSTPSMSARSFRQKSAFPETGRVLILLIRIYGANVGKLRNY